MLQGHGDDGYKHDKDIVADFSTNVWYGGAPAGLKEHVFGQWNKICRYPEVLGESLIEKIAVHHTLTDANILVTNGSTESIYLVAQAFKAKRTTIIIPTFAEYEDACKLHDHEIHFMDWNDLRLETELVTDLLFICNPNNPTGAIFEELEQLIALHPDIIFVVDEAFIAFTLSAVSVIHLIKQYNNLIVMHSMTKVYAIPGLRLGYIAASAGIIERIKKVKLPWTVNVMALEAGHFIFDRYHDLAIPIQPLLEDKAAFVTGLADMPLKIYNSHTHYFTAETKYQNAALLKQFLLKEFNILIRDASNFRGLGNNHIRIATLSKFKNKLMINALSTWHNT